MMKDIREPIIVSLLDDDWYKFTMGSVVFHMFPRARVSYEFINRGKTVFPEGFDRLLQDQINQLCRLLPQPHEVAWLANNPNMRPNYVEWWAGNHMASNEVAITQMGGELRIHIAGFWYRTIFWEVKLMAIISELYFRMTGHVLDVDWEKRLITKGDLLENTECKWMDFSTRRRLSLKVQSKVVESMKNRKGFIGTSNPYLAFKYKVPVVGTYAHEAVMAMSAKYGVRLANTEWMDCWLEHFEGKLAVALTDTFTTEIFLRDFNNSYAERFTGTRQDSDDPYAWADNKMLPHYQKLDIPASTKTLVFSDNLKVGPEKDLMVGSSYNYIPISRKYSEITNPTAGIGTFFSNDVGAKPLNMVIKMSTADFGDGPTAVVKLSDNAGKHTGNPAAITEVKRELGIV